tara:strand:+ start:206 stop:433 length:228 start_codon:yes stop_codon:yes gene_type:complete
MSNAHDATSEDLVILGMVHAFRAMHEVKHSKTNNDLNNVNFEFLIEVQKRNLSNPQLIDLENDMFDDSHKLETFK